MPSIFNFMLVQIFVLNLLTVYSETSLCNSYENECPADQEKEWSYKGNNGPDNWKTNFPDCGKQQQSPIDINTGKTVKDDDLKLEYYGYDIPVSQATFENSGCSVVVTPEDGIPRVMIANGKEFALQEIHFHWGCNSLNGSEHSINGQHTDMEMHCVHTNNDGRIFVFAVLLLVQLEDNEAFTELITHLQECRYQYDEANADQDLYLPGWFPKEPISIYRYTGSLTTPPCTEGVTWSIAKEPVYIGESQMEQFRGLFSVEKYKATPGCELSGNRRGIKPVNGRTVYESQ